MSKELSTNREDIKRIMFIVSKKGTVFGAVDSEDKLKYRRMISIRESIPKAETIIHNYRKQLGIEFKPMDTVGRNKKVIAEYIRNQIEEDYARDQITMKEYMDPFTGNQTK